MAATTGDDAVCTEGVSMVDLPEKHELETLTVSQSEDQDRNNKPNERASIFWRCRNDTICFPCISLRSFLERVWLLYGDHIGLGLKFLCFLAFLVYVGFALDHHFGDEQSVRLLVCTVIVVLVLLWRRCASSRCGRKGIGHVWKCCVQPVKKFYRRYASVIDTCIALLVIGAVVIFVIVDVALRRPASLVSAVGIVVLVTLMFLGSWDPRKVVWRPVCWGLLLQFVFALLVLRTNWGRAAFIWFSARMTEYMNYTESGSKFIFGDAYFEHFFAFRVLPTIIFFSATIAILYYVGAMQVLIRAIANVMHVTMGTGAMETFHAAVNIFCGWAEAIMVIRPFIDTLTLSELHAVMTNGFATVAGSTLAAYVLYGVSANHLISASFMSAPAALAMSKLFYPSQSSVKRRINLKEIPRPGQSLVDAAALGAVSAIGVVSHILVTVIAFISLLALVNTTLEWMGNRVGLTPPNYPTLSFQLICSYVLWPVVYLLGVPVQDCRVVARLLGMKIFINEFIAYSDLGHVRKNRVAFEIHVARNGTWRLADYVDGVELIGMNTTLVGGIISPRSEMLATYALCGFSDLVALGIMSAALSTVAPTRRQDILQVAPRALISGVVACLLTAAMAGLVADD